MRQVGDEPLLMLRKLRDTPIIVGRQRDISGNQPITRFQPEVLLLDDGFQHIQLRRDLDLVLIDATHPFGGEYLLPAGFYANRWIIFAAPRRLSLRAAMKSPISLRSCGVYSRLRRVSRFLPAFMPWILSGQLHQIHLWSGRLCAENVCWQSAGWGIRNRFATF